MKKYMDFKSTLQLATIDELTGLNNRSNLLRLFRARLHIRQFMHLSLIFIDLDFFKKINDRFGHQTGDRILRQVGDTIKKTIRKCDIAGRYGGEELMVLLPDTNIEQAELTAKRIRDEVNRIKIPVDSGTTSITASYGITSLIENEKYVSSVLGIESVEDLYNAASKKDPDWTKTNSMKMRLVDVLIKMVDTALYEAKNTVCKSCRYASLDSDLFKDKKCPRCYSDNIVIGRDKIVVFKG
jgi:diguanylate cyclase (GGDEF)-like protein